ncbi:executer 1 [Balamuthia mandrillaris]
MEARARPTTAEEERFFFPIDSLPPELKAHVFIWLDAKSLACCSLVCREWYAAVNQSIWKALCYRDFTPYIETLPLSPEASEDNTQKVTNEILRAFRSAMASGSDAEVTRAAQTAAALLEALEGEEEGEGEAQTEETGESEQQLHTKKSKDKEKEGLEERFAVKKECRQIDDWREFYRRCSGTPDLNGHWIGLYGSHGEELVKVTHYGYLVEALKITGDPNVPAGQITFRARMNETGRWGRGKVHLADTGFRNERWGLAFLDVREENHFVNKWKYEVLVAHTFDTHFRRETEAERLVRERREEEERVSREQHQQQQQHPQEEEEEEREESKRQRQK